jgi:hypothetical protein
MATTTYEPIATHTLGSAAANYTFSSIPSTYTDLVIVINGSTTGSCDLKWQANSDTGSNYSGTRVTGSGSAAFSSRFTSDTGAAFGWSNTSPSVNILQIQNYANTTTFKTSLGRPSNSNALVGAYAGLYRSTSAITSLNLMNTDGASFTSGTTFTLYGIANANTGAKATGGVITYDSTYYYHTFGASGTFTPTQSLTADYLVVAGGGGGGRGGGISGGGGAGGFKTSIGGSALSLTSGTSYTVTVGAGGPGGTNSTPGLDGVDGSNSVFDTITSTGGGGGGGGSGAQLDARAGGSGGGGGENSGATGTGGAASPSGQGNAGGVGGAINPSTGRGGGGGGAGAVGATGTASGNGGAGLSSSITGSSVTYAGGGGGGSYNTAVGAGGSGGGGAGGDPLILGVNAVAGTVNTGGGGGGNTGADGAAGGSGVVVIRYAK